MCGYQGMCRLALLAVLLINSGALAGEILYNGIELPDEWPPRSDDWTLEPMRIPYLECPPEVINIDVGRQLFVDDFVIQETNLNRTFHPVIFHRDNPIIKDAAPLSGGVWYDPLDKIFKMWYRYACDKCRQVGGRYATSIDGIHWERPALDVVPGTNIVYVENTGLPSDGNTDSRYSIDTTSVWIDYNLKETDWRYKMFYTPSYMGNPTRVRDDSSFAYKCSVDGIHWSNQPVALSGIVGDLTMAFYNPFRDKWVSNIRSGRDTGRARAYVEADDAALAVRLATAQPGGKVVVWLGADKLDPNLPGADQFVDLHHVSPIAYESLMLGFFTMCHSSFQKTFEVVLGYSRDGFHYDRPDRRPIFRGFHPVAKKQKRSIWNVKRSQSVTGACLVVRDRLYIYFVADTEWESARSTGLAFLRRDGFASMGSTRDGGQLLTRPLRFSGGYLFVNVDCDQGELRVEVLDKEGVVVPPFTADNCVPVRVNETLHRIEWKGALNLAPMAGESVRFRFQLRLGELYAFWVSRDESGASHGYVGAGGPGYTSFVDTVGEEAYR